MFHTKDQVCAVFERPFLYRFMGTGLLFGIRCAHDGHVDVGSRLPETYAFVEIPGKRSTI